jgi:hypothetical protein
MGQNYRFWSNNLARWELIKRLDSSLCFNISFNEQKHWYKIWHLFFWSSCILSSNLKTSLSKKSIFNEYFLTLYYWIKNSPIKFIPPRPSWNNGFIILFNNVMYKPCKKTKIKHIITNFGIKISYWSYSIPTNSK